LEDDVRLVAKLIKDQIQLIVREEKDSDEMKLLEPPSFDQAPGWNLKFKRLAKFRLTKNQVEIKIKSHVSHPLFRKF
jgi:hypothetical protein